jgi:cellulose synthase/poly-beta-1,6-N-acetylglucosamine synthase-like glycosyltransferase
MGLRQRAVETVAVVSDGADRESVRDGHGPPAVPGGPSPAPPAVAGGPAPGPAAGSAAGEAAYAVRFERCAEPRYIPVVFYLYLAVLVPFVIWRITIVNWHIWFGPLALAADLFAAMMFIFFLGFTRYLYVPAHRPAHPAARIVDCLIPTHTEPASLIEPTVIAALRVRGIRNVLVLGNFDRPDIRAMAERLGVAYHARNSNEHGKAGNLNNGLSYTNAEFILTLDSDHMALPEFLERTLGYFDDPAVAFVQTPQSFYNTTSLLYRRAHGKDSEWSESNIFYRCVQPAKNGRNASFYVGTSAVLRRAAIDDVGGFATGTVTEDIHTSLRIHAKGWRSVFIPEPLAFGLEAQSLKEFYAQRRRWAVGSLTLLFRRADSPLRVRGLTRGQRLSYLESTMAHLGGIQRLIHFLLPAIAIFTMRSPVSIPIGLYGLAFVVYFITSFSMVAVYSRGSYHFLHSDAYSLANLVAQVSALSGLLRNERRFHSARKEVPRAERTLVKPILWLLGLTSVAGVADGAYKLADGNHSWLVIMAIAWCTVNSVWMWWILGYLEVYERRQAITGLDGVGALDRYNLIMARFGESRPPAAQAGLLADSS